MTRKLSWKIPATASFVYGSTLAAMYALHSPGANAVAIVGAFVVGGCWTLRGLWAAGDTRRNHD